MAPSILTPTHRYGAGGLFALALHQAQIHQTRPLGLSSFLEENEPIEDRCSSSSSDSVSDDPDLWIHQDSGLLRPILRFLEIEKTAWLGLEETCGSPLANHHIGAFLRLLAEENDEPSSERMEQEYALSKAIDAMVISLEDPDIPSEPFSRDGKSSTCERQSPSKAAETRTKVFPETSFNTSSIKEGTTNTSSIKEGTTSSNASSIKEEATSSNISSMKEEVTSSNTSSMKEEVTSSNTSSIKVEATDLSDNKFVEEPIEEIMLLNYQRKVTVLHELISACLANIPEDDKKRSRQKKGYDARHRVALRLLATWLDVKWIKVEAIEVMVAFSAMALMKAEEEKEGSKPAQGKWSKFKRGGIIGAAALTGGALLALTGGLAAPAIAAGFGALAPTLGTLIPVIGAGGFAAIATAAGSVAGSVAVAASFGAAGAGLTGAKMARRTGSVDEFEFIAIGKNHNQGRLGVGILISGMAFEKEDFVRPWEQLKDNLERYAVQWESKNLIAVSTAIQDWLTSRLAMELMRQGAMMTVLSTLLAAFAWPATLLAATEFIDSKWTIAIDRSNKAGKLLAEALSKGLQGHRPVTLVGFSLGARVIFKCLQHLAEMQEAGIVERVVLLGAPISIKDENWGAARKMVAGRFVNVYSTSDWNLGVAFRASLLTKGLAGIQPVGIPGIENVDVTDMIEGHSSYLWTTGKILELLEMDTYYPVFRKSNAEPQKEEVKEEKA